ncbi:hypothetical protein C8Q80DRAFT_1166112 [Daedaleopsis nitida]|nr:hypothetical protein C8Q80DRAFT_1166112 [Daedaleopsis nitida]
MCVSLRLCYRSCNTLPYLSSFPSLSSLPLMWTYSLWYLTRLSLLCQLHDCMVNFTFTYGAATQCDDFEMSWQGHRFNFFEFRHDTYRDVSQAPLPQIPQLTPLSECSNLLSKTQRLY